MLKYSVYVFAAAVVLTGNYDSHAGLFSSRGDRQPSQPSSEQQQAQAAPEIPAPAEQAAQQGPAAPTRTPDPAVVEQLKKELAWESVPKDLFKRYAGKWIGNFWVYSPVGKKEQVQQVQIEYIPESDGSMTMRTHSYDMLSKAWVVQETARYSVEGDKVQVEIRRPTGKIARQNGHFKDGQLFLQAEITDGAEHFRERIDGNRLLIDGYGIYMPLKNKDQHIFIGRFKKQ